VLSGHNLLTAFFYTYVILYENAFAAPKDVRIVFQTARINSKQIHKNNITKIFHSFR